MSTCCQHDWIDLLAALGPTLATLFAAAATISVYRRGEKLQRQLVRPLIVIRQGVDPAAPFWRWRVEIRNEGKGAANIESFTVVAKDEILSPEAMEPPSDFWSRVFNKLGVLRIQKIESAHLVSPPLSIGGGASYLLCDAFFAGERKEIDSIVRGLEIGGICRSELGDISKFRGRYGADP